MKRDVCPARDSLCGNAVHQFHPTQSLVCCWADDIIRLKVFGRLFRVFLLLLSFRWQQPLNTIVFPAFQATDIMSSFHSGWLRPTATCLKIVVNGFYFHWNWYEKCHFVHITDLEQCAFGSNKSLERQTVGGDITCPVFLGFFFCKKPDFIFNDFFLRVITKKATFPTIGIISSHYILGSQHCPSRQKVCCKKAAFPSAFGE